MTRKHIRQNIMSNNAISRSLTSLGQRQNEEEEIEAPQSPRVIHKKVAIVGAGVSGLMTAKHLFESCSSLDLSSETQEDQPQKTSYSTSGIRPEDVIILEARDRVGGRIHTVRHEVISKHVAAQEEDGSEGQKNHVIAYEEGAAWVHGTLPAQIDDESNQRSQLQENPMIALIQQAGDNCGGRLNAVFERGNPWTKPRQVLMPSTTTTTFSSRVTAGGAQLQNDDDSSHLLALYIDGKEPSLSTIESALREHESQMRAVSKIGNAAFAAGDGMSSIRISLAETLAALSEFKRDRRKQVRQQAYMQAATEKIKNSTMNEDEIMMDSIANFYLHLLEAWNGCSASDMQLSDFSGGDIHEDTMGGDYDSSSAEVMCEDDGSFPGPHCTVWGGMGNTLVQSLLKGDVEQCVVCNEEVLVIEQCYNTSSGVGLPDSSNSTALIQEQPNASKGGDDIADIANAANENTKIALHCKSGQIIVADACVVTVPLGCLKSSVNGNGGIRFQPSLSQEKIEGINALGVGNYKKVLLTFDSIFWPDQPLIGLIRTKTRITKSHSTTAKHNNLQWKKHPHMKKTFDIGNYLLLDNLWTKRNHDHDLPIIEAILVGKAAQNATSQPDAVIRDTILDFMQATMSNPPDDISKKCVACHVTRWEEDVYSKGAYSCSSLGSLQRHFDAVQMSEWDDRLLFAGEATNVEYQGSVHAALLSGVEAAESIEALGLK